MPILIFDQCITTTLPGLVPELYATVTRQNAQNIEHILMMESMNMVNLFDLVFSRRWVGIKNKEAFYTARSIDQLAMMAQIQRVAGIHCLDRNPGNFLWSQNENRGVFIDHAHAIIEVRSPALVGRTLAAVYTDEWNMEKVDPQFRWNMYYHFLWTQVCLFSPFLSFFSQGKWLVHFFSFFFVFACKAILHVQFWRKSAIE